MATTRGWSYELSGEWPNERRNEWLVSLFAFRDGELVASTTSAHREYHIALESVMSAMHLVLRELDNGGQLLFDLGDVHVRYGPSVIR